MGAIMRGNIGPNDSFALLDDLYYLWRQLDRLLPFVSVFCVGYRSLDVENKLTGLTDSQIVQKTVSGTLNGQRARAKQT